LLRADILRHTGVATTLKTRYYKQQLLPLIAEMPALEADRGTCELHMLLHKGKLLEGAWALYSFLFHSASGIRVVIHSDGSLDADCAAVLSRLFRGVRVISREESDRHVLSQLNRLGLPHCADLRRRFVLSLKLFDPHLYTESDSYIILDSDILTFSSPWELVEERGDTRHLYSPDNNECQYSRPVTELQESVGRVIARRLNSGLLRILRRGISFNRIDEAIAKAGILHDQPISHYAEQTLYACELPVQGAVALDPARYTICGDPCSPETVTGHYCGGGYWATRFYREGLPRLASQFRVS
jgi:hypothetical protein